jgi:hypothetical protein
MPSHEHPADYLLEVNPALSFRSIDQGSLSARSIAWATMISLLLYIPTAFIIGYEVNRPTAYANFHARHTSDDDEGNPIVRPKVLFSFSPAQWKPGETVTLTANVIAPAGSPKPKGSVRFLIGYETLKFGTLTTSPTSSSVSIQAKIPRLHAHDPLRALYLGDDTYSSSYSDPSPAQ